MTITDQLLKFLGEVLLYGGGSAAVAYLLFQFLGKSWIDSKFTERLETFKHQQALELQHLKVQIESMLSGALKLQEREFTVLPDAWQKLNDAYGLTSWATSPLQEYPAVGRMADDEFEEFLASSELLESQKSRVRTSEAQSRDKTYQDIIFWHRIHKAKKATADLQTYVAANGLFLPPPLKQQFSEMLPILWSTISSAEVGHEAKEYKMQNEGWKELQAKGEPLHKAIETSIEERLHAHARK
jgi:hypothetical protein